MKKGRERIVGGSDGSTRFLTAVYIYACMGKGRKQIVEHVDWFLDVG